MALRSTIYKAQLAVADVDRGYYADHALTLARHPSETEERMMVRVLAFALHASESLSFGRGLSSEEEADLWARSLTGEIDLWIYLGQPEEARIRKACGRARQVVLVGYSGRSFAIWWEKQQASLARCENLTVIEVPAEAVEALGGLIGRNMAVQVLIQDGEVQWMSDAGTLAVTPVVRQAAVAN